MTSGKNISKIFLFTARFLRKQKNVQSLTELKTLSETGHFCNYIRCKFLTENTYSYISITDTPPVSLLLTSLIVPFTSYTEPDVPPAIIPSRVSAGVNDITLSLFV